MDATRDFILSHRDADIRRLALQAARFPEVDMPWALQQIAGWQVARQKVPLWAANDGVEYPPHLSLEQCSSQTTAEYKVAVVCRLLSRRLRMADLTGGMGVDCAFLARHFQETVYVERQPELCQLASRNFAALGLPHIQVVNATAEEYLPNLGKVSLLYLDPARRTSVGGRAYAIADCTPDILPMKSAILGAADLVIVKLSPMLDWHLAVQQLNSDGPCVSEVHIVSVRNECKELLFVLCKDAGEQPVLHCVNDSQCDIFQPSAPLTAPVEVPETPSFYLYEPSASIMKSGCFGQLAQRYALTMAAPNSHLFFSCQPVEDFPGRTFRVTAVCTMNKRELTTALKGVSQANITVRNFPLTARQLRQRLRLSDGGDLYIFATTTAENSHKLFLCRRF